MVTIVTGPTVFGEFTESPGNNKGAKATQKLKMRQSPFEATKEGPNKRHSPRAGQGGLLELFIGDNEGNTYNTAESSWLVAPTKRVRITATSDKISVEDMCLKFDDDQRGSWSAPSCEAVKYSDIQALEEDQFK